MGYDTYIATPNLDDEQEAHELNEAPASSSVRGPNRVFIINEDPALRVIHGGLGKGTLKEHVRTNVNPAVSIVSEIGTAESLHNPLDDEWSEEDEDAREARELNGNPPCKVAGLTAQVSTVRKLHRTV